MDWTLILWFLVSGVLLITMGTVGPLIKTWWLTSSVVYLLIGIGIGPSGLGLLDLDLIEDATLLEHLTEVAVIISLFGAGMKMRIPLRSRLWVGPLVLAFATMLVTVGLTAAVGLWAIGLPLGAAVLLGAVLAPTDPVLAAEVQLDDPDDKDELRVMLTGEAGFNDGTAFPMVVLAVGLVAYALHPLGEYGWKWVAVDVGWRILGGLGIGYGLGHLVGRGVLWVRKRVSAGIGADEMLTLGFIALIYGVALAAYTYAFLAVFAAAYAARQLELAENESKDAEEALQEAKEAEADNEADAPEHAEAMLARSGTLVADTAERLVEVTLVVMVGAMLAGAIGRGGEFGFGTWWWFVPAMILLVRPAAVLLTLWQPGVTWPQRGLVAWFGIRGIGTLYYLTHAFGFGVSDELPAESRLVADLCLATIAASVIVHGTSVTPLMRWYAKRDGSGSPGRERDEHPDSLPPRPAVAR